MSRSKWKGPFVDSNLLREIKINKKVFLTKSRNSTIIPSFVGKCFKIYNGKIFHKVIITENMVGHKLGEFSPTRTFYGHTPADKKAKPATAVKK